MSILDNLDYERIDDSKIEWLLSELDKCSLSPEAKQMYEMELLTFDITPERAYEISLIIKEAEVCPIQSGSNYTQTDINKKIKKEIL